MARGAGRVRFGLAIVVLIMLSVVAWGARSAWRVRRALLDERRPTRAMVVKGIASGPVWTSDLGHTTAEQTKQGTIQVLHEDCFVSHVDGMRIEDPLTHVTYTLLDVDDVALGQAFLAIDHPGHVALSLDQAEPDARPATDVPARKRGACEDARLPNESYYEVSRHVVSPGARVTVRACTNDEPNVLVPCGDGLDVVTTSSLVAIRRNLVQDSSAAIMLGAIAALSLLGIGSFVPALRSSRRKAKP